MINISDLKQIGKIVIDRDLCIGAGPCAVLAPNTFDIVDGKAVLKNPDGTENVVNDTPQEIIDAAMSCPVIAIKIYDLEGKLIYPN